MTKRFTKAERQSIVEDFASRHDGFYNPTAFLAEVHGLGTAHPAYEWFEWDADKAALAWQIEQARDFARDIRISFRVETVGNDKPISVREQTVPLVLSPLEGRREGGGYYVVNPKNPNHMIEHCRQAASSLSSWLHRYESALTFAGLDAKAARQMILLLEHPLNGAGDGEGDARKAA